MLEHTDTEEISNLDNAHGFYEFLESHDIDLESAVPVKGRLRENIEFWRNIGACRWVLSVIENGYYLPFISILECRTFKNPSVGQHRYFGSQEVRKLVASGVLVEEKAEDLTVVNPLGVVQNACGKSRLILDLRYVNKFLRSCKFKYEGIKTAADLFQKTDWVFKFDYKSGYHRVDIFEPHTKFLGCAFMLDNQTGYFKFTVLPFGLATGPYVFTKIQKALVKALAQ